MVKLDVQYDIINDQPANASPVEANFNRIEQHINQELINRDGTVAMAAQLKLVGDPVSALDAVTRQYVDTILPVGIISMYGGVAAPPGGKWAVCNGAELESTLYPELFAIIGASYSVVGVPAGRFNLPNLTDRFPVGAGAIASLGKTGGSRDAVVPTHSHSIDHSHAAVNTGNAGNDHTHVAPDHLHSININTGQESGLHVHGPGGSASEFLMGQHGAPLNVALGGSSQPYSAPGTTGSQSAFHIHLVNGSSGSADRTLTTTGHSANHIHAVTVPAHAGRSGVEGVAVTDTNLPPYVGITYIMRIQ